LCFIRVADREANAMETDHRVVVGDARSLDEVDDDSVDLVVTSPPYPMVEMWDDQFVAASSAVAGALEAADGWGAFEAMHDVLDDVWAEVARVLVRGGVACVVVGDATRTVGGRFRAYPNHARVIEAFEALGFDPLPELLWRKPTNSAAKFMGSGMVPPNAYVTLEHEHVLVFRNGERRSFEPGADRRYEAAYFWEERNRWFSDVWTDVAGTTQPLAAPSDRERSGAYPLAVPYRLVNMYSVYGDTVIDPFVGTGTTTVAAMVAGRNSVGYELDAGVRAVLDDRVREVVERSRRVVRSRLDDHRAFAAERAEAGDPLAYEADNYDFRVRTRQERPLRLYVVDDWEATDEGYRVVHAPADGAGGDDAVPTGAVDDGDGDRTGEGDAAGDG
jgi:DNA modification methylase